MKANELRGMGRELPGANRPPTTARDSLAIRLGLPELPTRKMRIAPKIQREYATAVFVATPPRKFAKRKPARTAGATANTHIKRNQPTFLRIRTPNNCSARFGRGFADGHCACRPYY